MAGEGNVYINVFWGGDKTSEIPEIYIIHSNSNRVFGISSYYFHQHVVMPAVLQELVSAVFALGICLVLTKFKPRHINDSSGVGMCKTVNAKIFTYATFLNIITDIFSKRQPPLSYFVPNF